MEYSFRIFGNSYHYIFDALFKPKISIEQKITKKMDPWIEEESTMLIHVLQFEPSHEKMLTIDLPKKALALDFKKANNPLENWIKNKEREKSSSDVRVD